MASTTTTSASRLYDGTLRDVLEQALDDGERP
jgi:hypothetical protein